MIAGYKNIVFDLDGTITKDISTWNTVHKALGVEEKSLKYYNKVKGNFEQGKKVDAMEWAQHDINLWKGRHIGEVVSAVTPVSFFDNAVDTIRHLKHVYNMEMFIISGTFDRFLEEAVDVIDDDGRGKYITDWNCHTINTDDFGKITGVDVDPTMIDKKVGIKDMARAWNFKLEETIVIGNGSNDIPMMEEAGFAIAFNPNNKRVRDACDVTIMSDDFRDIFRYLVGVDWEYTASACGGHCDGLLEVTK